MAQKKITDLQQIASVDETLSLPCDDSTQTYRVTTAQLLAFIRANITLPTSGDVKFTYKTVADSGWIMATDGTIGSASSGASIRANADTEDLYTLLWNNVSNTNAPVTGGRGASAAADFAANKPLALPKALGRAVGVAGAGSGLTSRALGAVVGAETHQLTSTEMPSHTHTQNAHNHIGGLIFQEFYGLGFYGNSGVIGSGNYASPSPTGNANRVGQLTSSTTATNNNTGGDGAHNNMQPTTFLNVMIKL